jgi:hypothetical protein
LTYGALGFRAGSALTSSSQHSCSSQPTEKGRLPSAAAMRQTTIPRARSGSRGGASGCASARRTLGTRSRFAASRWTNSINVASANQDSSKDVSPRPIMRIPSVILPSFSMTIPRMRRDTGNRNAMMKKKGSSAAAIV